MFNLMIVTSIFNSYLEIKAARLSRFGFSVSRRWWVLELPIFFLRHRVDHLQLARAEALHPQKLVAVAALFKKHLF